MEPLAALRDDPEGVAARTADWARRFDRLLVHVDADVLEFDAFPIAENTSRLPGLDLPGLTRLLRDLCGLPSWRALTLAEINPEHAPANASSFDALISGLTHVLRPR